MILGMPGKRLVRGGNGTWPLTRGGSLVSALRKARPAGPGMRATSSRGVPQAQGLGDWDLGDWDWRTLSMGAALFAGFKSLAS